MERFGPYSVELSNTDKVLFPEDGITKGDLIDYYREVADFILPHLDGRPLTLHRFPDGIGSEGFYQQSAADYFPDWIQTHEAPRASGKGKPVEHIVCRNQATLAYLANQGTIAFHGWGARLPKLDRPDRLVFDLDPASADFVPVRNAARQVAALMDDVGLHPFPMTTGSRGLHVVAPLRRDASFDEVRQLARDMAARLAEEHPDSLTVEQRKNKRAGRIYLDVMRNAYGQTAVMPYSVRALAGAPIATPLSREELGGEALDPKSWTIKNIRRRLGQKGAAWAAFKRHAVSCRTACDALEAKYGD